MLVSPIRTERLELVAFDPAAILHLIKGEHDQAERVPREIVIEPIDDNNCTVLARSNSVEMLALYLGMLDADFTVAEPPELIARLNTLAERYSKAAGNVG